MTRLFNISLVSAICQQEDCAHPQIKVKCERLNCGGIDRYSWICPNSSNIFLCVPQVLENCSKVMEILCNEEYAIASRCAVAKSTLLDRIVQRYKDIWGNFFQEVRGNTSMQVMRQAKRHKTKYVWKHLKCSGLSHDKVLEGGGPKKIWKYAVQRVQKEW